MQYNSQTFYSADESVSQGLKNNTTGSCGVSIAEIISLISSFRIGIGFYLLIDLRSMKYVCVSPSVKIITGYSAEAVMKGGSEFITGLCHPNERTCRNNVHEEITSFFQSLIPEEKLKYRYSYPVRILRSDGRYICLLCQFICLNEVAGDLLRPSHGLLFFTDITMFLNKDIMALAINKYDETDGFSDNVYHYMLNGKLTKRETEIYRLVCQGLTSKEISGKLNISKNTVDTHRRRIGKKLR